MRALQYAHCNWLRLFLAVLLIGTDIGPVVNAASAVNGLRGVNGKLGDLDAEFATKMREIFYDQQQVAEADEDYIRLAILAEIAENECVLYASQRRGLMIVGEVIKRYFVTKRRRIRNIVVGARELLIDLVIRSAIERSVVSAHRFVELEKRRKTIYMLLRQYEQTTGIRNLARRYSSVVVSMETRQISGREKLEETLDRYKDDVASSTSLVLTTRETLVAIDNLLSEEAAGVVDWTVMVDQKLLHDIELAKRKAISEIGSDYLNITRIIKLGRVVMYENR